MNPAKFAQMMKYLTRVKKEKPDLPDVFPASKAPIPPVREDVETTKMFNRFNQANPRTEKADGGMLVKPGFGGTRQGYREARLRSSEKKIIQTQVIDSYNKLVNYAVNNRKIKNFAEPVEIMVKGKIKKFNYLPSIEEFAKITETQPRFFYQQPTTVAERKAGGKQKLLVIANKKQAFADQFRYSPLIKKIDETESAIESSLTSVKLKRTFKDRDSVANVNGERAVAVTIFKKSDAREVVVYPPKYNALV